MWRCCAWISRSGGRCSSSSSTSAAPTRCAPSRTCARGTSATRSRGCGSWGCIAGLPAHRGPGVRAQRGGALRPRLRGRHRRRVAGLEAVRRPRLARALPVRPEAPALRVPPRRGRLRRDRGAIGELLGHEVVPVPPVRPEDAPDVVLVEPTREHPGPFTGAYGAGAVHVVVSGTGELVVDGERAVDRAARACTRWSSTRCTPRRRSRSSRRTASRSTPRSSPPGSTPTDPQRRSARTRSSRGGPSASTTITRPA